MLLVDVAMNRWGHGQTFTGGAIAGLMLAQRPLLIFVGGVLAGVAVTLLAKFGRRLGELVVAWIARGRRVRTVNGRARVVRARGR